MWRFMCVCVCVFHGFATASMPCVRQQRMLASFCLRAYHDILRVVKLPKRNNFRVWCGSNP